ncbi:MAG: hypothetical protein LBM87_00655 [Ruminococcus sp.]|nr:hypothetical protein [Ruminococcus sp.]
MKSKIIVGLSIIVVAVCMILTISYLNTNTGETKIKYLPENKTTDDIYYGTDSLSFQNTSQDFFTVSTPDELRKYTLTGLYYKYLTDGETNSTISSIDSLRNQNWFGSCFGMSAAVVLSKAGEIDPEFFQSNADEIYNWTAPRNSLTITNTVNFYMLSQVLPKVQFARLGKVTEEAQNEAIVKALTESKYPVLLCIDLFYKDGSRAGGHAVVGYDMYLKDNWYTMNIWDPNDSSRYYTLRISTDFKQTEFPGYYYDVVPRAAITYESGLLSLKDLSKFFREQNYTQAPEQSALPVNMSATAFAGEIDTISALDFSASTQITEDSFTSLTVNYNSFKIKDNFGRSAVVENGIKTSGDLEITEGMYLNAPGSEICATFYLPSGYDYTVTEMNGADKFKTQFIGTGYTDSEADGYFSSVTAVSPGTITSGAGGGLMASFPENTEVTANVSSDSFTNDIYAYEVTATESEIMIVPTLEGVVMSGAEGTLAAISAKGVDSEDVVFENVNLTVPSSVTVTANADSVSLDSGLRRETEGLTQKPVDYSGLPDGAEIVETGESYAGAK